MDLICDPEDKKCAYSLVTEALTYLETQHVAKIWAFFTLPAKRRLLYRLGFVRTGITPQFTYRPQPMSGKRHEFGKIPWDFSHGDGDLELYH